MADARALLETASAVFEAEGLMQRAARVSSVLANIDYREGHPPAAVARLEATLAELEPFEADEVVAEVAAQLGRFHVLNRQHELAAPRLEVALELAEALRLPEVFAQALISKSVLYTYRNRLEEGRILLEGALERALEGELHAAALRAFNNLAVILESSDSYAEAIELTERALELARRVGDRVWENLFIGGPISGLTMLGRWDEALVRKAEFESRGGLDIDSALSFPAIEIFCARGDLVEARAWFDEQSEIAKGDEDVQVRGGNLLAEAQVLRAEGKPRDALRAAEEVLGFTGTLGITFLTVKLALVEGLESAFTLGDAQKTGELLALVDELRPGECPPLLAAHAHRFRGKLAGDESEFAAAEGRFRELSLRFYLAITLLEHAELIDEQGSRDEAALLLSEARAIFEELGARPWLDRVDLRAEVLS
jgi:tetratricopeptide (TPR) repeat protein